MIFFNKQRIDPTKSITNYIIMQNITILITFFVYINSLILNIICNQIEMIKY